MKSFFCGKRELQMSVKLQSVDDGTKYCYSLQANLKMSQRYGVVV
jgi:hypothetical protein